MNVIKKLLAKISLIKVPPKGTLHPEVQKQLDEMRRMGIKELEKRRSNPNFKEQEGFEKPLVSY